MKKTAFVSCVLALFLLSTVALAGTVDQKDKVVHVKIQKTLTRAAFDKAKPPAPHLSATTMQGEPIWTDDFEGTQDSWVSDATWNHVDAPGGGRAFQPFSSWEPTDANSSSPTHSWHAQMGLDQELDFVVSPVIYLPTDIGGSEMKGLELDYMVDVDAAEGTNSWYHLVGSAECWWGFTATDPGAGASSWYMEPHDIPHWRQWLVTPEIDLATATTPITLDFMHKFDSEVEFDYYAVDVSTDGFQTYDNLGFFDGSAPELNWVNVQYNLDAYAGQTVQVRFSSKGDYGTAEGFWGVDDIKVSDSGGDLFTDDGGETGVTTMTKGGFAPGGRFTGISTEGWASATPDWGLVQDVTTLEGRIEVPGFNTSIFAGDSIRIALNWDSDGTATTGRGFYFDDITLYGIGALPYDVAAIGVLGDQNAVVGHTLSPRVVVMNVGTDSITGNLLYSGAIESADGTPVQPGMFGSLAVTDFAPGDIAFIPTNPVRAWLVDAPGVYVFNATVTYAQDGNPADNVVEQTFTVHGPPFTEVVYRQNFEQLGGFESSLEDFGFTVENGGGCDATGLNDNMWVYDPATVFGSGMASLSEFWGYIDPGPDAVAPWDSSEVLDESFTTPPIDISTLDKHATLYMRYYVYWRAGYGSYWPEGEQWNDFSIDFSIDGGDTWYQAFIWTDYDSMAGTGQRLPNCYYGPDCSLNYLSHLGVDLTPAVRMGGEELLVRFRIWSENSWFVACFIDDILIYSGVGRANISSVDDVPEDQGKQVRVCWDASFNDLTYWTENMYGEYEEHIVTHYNLWRVYPEPLLGAAGAKVVSNMQAMLTADAQIGDKFIVGDDCLEFIAQIPAHQGPCYCYVAPTLWDDVETCFMVSAHTCDPMVFVDSNIMCGVSEDNLAPSAPMNLSATGANSDNILTWDASPEEDVQYYSVYRSETSGSYPSEALYSTTDLTYTDAGTNVGTEYFYVVTATDFAGNESVYSGEASWTTGVGDNASRLPDKFGLSQNYPNPFNPTTRIEYQLPKDADVSITVYNTSGQIIRTLVTGHVTAGYHSVEWDGTNAAGQKVSSGVYLYKMTSESFTDIKRFVLLK